MISKNEALPQSANFIGGTRKIQLATDALLAVNPHFEKNLKKLKKRVIRELSKLVAENRPPIRVAYSSTQPKACFAIINGSHSLAAACQNGERVVSCELVNIDNATKLIEKLVERNIRYDRELTPEELNKLGIAGVSETTPNSSEQISKSHIPRNERQFYPGKLLFDLAPDMSKEHFLQKLSGVMVSIHVSQAADWPAEAVKKLLELLAEIHCS